MEKFKKFVLSISTIALLTGMGINYVANNNAYANQDGDVKWSINKQDDKLSVIVGKARTSPNIISLYNISKNINDKSKIEDKIPKIKTISIKTDSKVIKTTDDNPKIEVDLKGFNKIDTIKTKRVDCSKIRLDTNASQKINLEVPAKELTLAYLHAAVSNKANIDVNSKNSIDNLIVSGEARFILNKQTMHAINVEPSATLSLKGSNQFVATAEGKNFIIDKKGILELENGMSQKFSNFQKLEILGTIIPKGQNKSKRQILISKIIKNNNITKELLVENVNQMSINCNDTIDLKVRTEPKNNNSIVTLVGKEFNTNLEVIGAKSVQNKENFVTISGIHKIESQKYALQDRILFFKSNTQDNIIKRGVFNNTIFIFNKDDSDDQEQKFRLTLEECEGKLYLIHNDSNGIINIDRFSKQTIEDKEYENIKEILKQFLDNNQEQDQEDIIKDIKNILQDRDDQNKNLRLSIIDFNNQKEQELVSGNYYLSTAAGHLMSDINSRIKHQSAGEDVLQIEPRVWATGSYSKGIRKSYKGSSGFNSNAYMFTAGLDTLINSKTLIGVAISHGKSRIHYTGFEDKERIKVLLGSLYLRHELENNNFVKVIGSIGKAKINEIFVYSKAQYNRLIYSCEAMVGHNFNRDNNIRITPMLGAKLTNMPSKLYYRKFNNDQGILVHKSAIKKVEALAGFNISKLISYDDMSLIPSVHMQAGYIIKDKIGDISMNFSNKSRVINMEFPKSSRFSFNGGTSLSIIQGSKFSYKIGYAIKLSKKYTEHQATLSLKLKF